MKKRVGSSPGVRTEGGGRGVVSRASPGAQAPKEPGRPGSQGPRQVVAVILMWRGRIGLFKRSGSVQHDAGLWHCITGYLDADSDPVRQAIQEIWEETLLPARALEQLTAGPTLRLADPRGGPDWTVHTFLACTSQRRLTLNWEHKAYRWVRPWKLSQFDGQVAWLTDVLRAVASLPSAKACEGVAS
ncbi:NUDIX domain-containing protein [Streptomyces sp. NBRC 110028]|uniref:NUDIX domain-containing protein n=1 Tax=Streptomyces sp. NBRC 110028 TaxID=1621260 RepID=UPI00099EDF30